MKKEITTTVLVAFYAIPCTVLQSAGECAPCKIGSQSPEKRDESRITPGLLKIARDEAALDKSGSAAKPRSTEEDSGIDFEIGQGGSRHKPGDTGRGEDRHTRS